MRVAIFTDTYLPQVNGVSKTIKRITQYYESKDIPYIIISPDCFQGYEQSANEKFFSISFLLYPECRITFPNLYRLNKIMQDFQPTLIQCMTEFNLGVVGLWYAKKHSIPSISNYSTNFDQYLNYYHLNIMKTTLWSYLRWFHNQHTHTLCPSNTTKQYLQENGINHVTVFTRGVDSKQFSPIFRDVNFRKSLGIQNKIALLYVGRLAPEKDLDLLRVSYQTLLKRFGDKVALVVTGDGPLMTDMKETFPKQTIFTGYQAGFELAKIYASCDIFVFPSSTETLGNVVLEANASGLPVVGVNAGGVASLITDDLNGYLAAPHDTISFTQHIEMLINNDITRQNMGNQSIHFAKQQDWTRTLNELVEIQEHFAKTLYA